KISRSTGGTAAQATDRRAIGGSRLRDTDRIPRIWPKRCLQHWLSITFEKASPTTFSAQNVELVFGSWRQFTLFATCSTRHCFAHLSGSRLVLCFLAAHEQCHKKLNAHDREHRNKDPMQTAANKMACRFLDRLR